MSSASDEKHTQQIAALQWVHRLRRSDENALVEMMRAYAAPLARFTFHYVHSREVAEELVQDVFLRVWELRASLDPTVKIKAYLFTAARNRAISYLRHEKVERVRREVLEPFVEPVSPSPEGELEEKEMQRVVQKAVNSLPDRCRLIFNLHREEGLTYSEIAGVLDISVKTVETQMVRALKTLRKRLASYLPVMTFFAHLSDRLS